MWLSFGDFLGFTGWPLREKVLDDFDHKYVLGVVTVCTPYINYLNIRFLAVFDFIGFAYMVVF